MIQHIFDKEREEFEKQFWKYIMVAYPNAEKGLFRGMIDFLEQSNKRILAAFVEDVKKKLDENMPDIFHEFLQECLKESHHKDEPLLRKSRKWLFTQRVKEEVIDPLLTLTTKE